MCLIRTYIIYYYYCYYYFPQRQVNTMWCVECYCPSNHEFFHTIVFFEETQAFPKKVREKISKPNGESAHGKMMQCVTLLQSLHTKEKYWPGVGILKLKEQTSLSLYNVPAHKLDTLSQGHCDISRLIGYCVLATTCNGTFPL